MGNVPLQEAWAGELPGAMCPIFFSRRRDAMWIFCLGNTGTSQLALAILGNFLTSVTGGAATSSSSVAYKDFPPCVY